ncbi:hypothetical protein [Gimibacter soli]|uniref:Uncharacterized protein n=1 Tax=Gimibacter soli TaxID=3024400 RepID=A0AAE9XSB2_9PROT|nr:hypothetical protein [Gimibacter soli]WCL54100.1 hypothetical protein PH603_16300 [Gimibacter soli]
MTTRTITQTVFFQRPFTLKGYAKTLAPGVYDIEIEEQILDTMTARAYRQTQVSIHLPPDPDRPGVEETLVIDPQVLDAALLDDISSHRPQQRGGRDTTKRRTASAIERGENEGMALANQPGSNTLKLPF